MNDLPTCGAGRRNKSVRSFPGGILRRGLLAAGIAVVGLTAGPAAADVVDVEVEWVNNPSVIVESDGKEYTGVKNTSNSVNGKIKIHIDAEVTGRVESWFAWPRLALSGDNPGFPSSAGHDFKDNGASKSYSTPRPKEVSESFNFAISRQEYEEFMVIACNLHADSLRGQGLNNSQIFDENRVIEIVATSRIEAELSGPDRLNPPPQEVTQLKWFNVVCERDDSLDEPAEPEIAGAYMTVKTVQTDALRGTCELEISGSIISQEPYTQVKFVYVDDKGKKSDLKSVTTTNEANITFKHRYPIGPGEQSGRIRMVGQSHAFFSNWWDYEADCSAPPQDIATLLPPKAVSVEAHLTGDEVMHRGLACPKEARIYGVMVGRGEVEGAAALFADGQLKKLQQYDIEDGQNVVIQGDYVFDWSKTQLPQQNVKFTFNISNKAGDLVDQMEATQNFTCRQIKTSGVASGAAGGFASDQPDPQASQQQRPQAATGQLAIAPAMAIMAPKGRVRSGDIRLSGGTPGATYKLTFLRRSGAGYTAVNAAQLPKQMKGPNASFPLAALTGGRAWRLQVCPLGAAPAQCKTSDFSIPAIGAKTGGQSSEPPQQPAAVIVVPGVMN